MDSCTLGQSVVHFLTVNYSVVVGGGGDLLRSSRSTSVRYLMTALRTVVVTGVT